jgi:hypothetical protein
VSIPLSGMSLSLFNMSIRKQTDEIRGDRSDAHDDASEQRRESHARGSRGSEYTVTQMSPDTSGRGRPRHAVKCGTDRSSLTLCLLQDSKTQTLCPLHSVF